MTNVQEANETGPRHGLPSPEQLAGRAAPNAAYPTAGRRKTGRGRWT